MHIKRLEPVCQGLIQNVAIPDSLVAVSHVVRRITATMASVASIATLQPLLRSCNIRDRKSALLCTSVPRWSLPEELERGGWKERTS